MQKGQTPVLILVGILIIMAVAGGAYYLGKSQAPKPKPQNSVVTSQTPQSTPISFLTPDLTINWKQYLGSDFTFKYPSSWTFGASDPTYISLLDPKYSDPNCRGDCPVFTIDFHVQKNLNNLDLETIIQNNYKSVAGLTGDYNKVKTEDFTDKNGVHYKKAIGIPGGGFYQLYTLKNNKIYILSPGAGVNGMLDDESDPKVKTDLEIFDQILSTFKFQ